MADLLHPGDYGVVVVAETTIKQGFDQLMTTPPRR